MITAIYQNRGSSSHLLAKKFGDLHHTKATHTGTLDPMADGVLIVLSGKDRFKKNTYSGWKKTYHFTILVGFETDSHDLLGLITDSKNSYDLNDVKHRINENLDSLTGSYAQLIPSFSSKRHDGTSFFSLAKKGITNTSHSQHITIYDLEQTTWDNISGEELSTQINAKISSVSGDFRQSKIKNQWQHTIDKKNTYHLLSVVATTSKRTYVRGVVRDLSTVIQVPLTTYSITRTKNGPYSIKDCICLV